jgi:hypothetical protein
MYVLDTFDYVYAALLLLFTITIITHNNVYNVYMYICININPILSWKWYICIFLWYVYVTGITLVFEKFLTFGDGPSDAVIVNNDDWLSHLNYLDFLRQYGPLFSINRMVNLDSVKVKYMCMRTLHYTASLVLKCVCMCIQLICCCCCCCF